MISKLGRNDECWCGSHKKYKKCHALLEDKMSLYKLQGFEVPNIKLLKTLAQIEGIRASSKINIAVLDCISECVVEGVSTGEIDRLIHDKTIEFGGFPAPLHYNGFPKSACISINDIVCHGIPSENVMIRNGDIVNIDVSTLYKGYYSDSSRMFCIGAVTEEKLKLVNVAKKCMEIGIQQIKPWGFLGDIGGAVNRHARKNGCTVVREIGGHGIGLQFHEDPWVSYVSKSKTGMILVPGLVFTVEPMINLGKAQVKTDRKDGWTVFTADGKPSAQWEKTVLVTDTGYEILTY